MDYFDRSSVDSRYCMNADGIVRIFYNTERFLMSSLTFAKELRSLALMKVLRTYEQIKWKKLFRKFILRLLQNRAVRDFCKIVRNFFITFKDFDNDIETRNRF